MDIIIIININVNFFFCPQSEFQVITLRVHVCVHACVYVCIYLSLDDILTSDHQIVVSLARCPAHLLVSVFIDR